MVEGTNFWLNIDEPTKTGFFTARYVEARDQTMAIERALELINEELKSKIVILNDADDPPKMEVSEIVELNSFAECDVPGRGFTFYPDDTDSIN
jgi:hypothetical protein